MGGVLKNRCTYLDVHKGADGFFVGVRACGYMFSCLQRGVCDSAPIS